MSVLLCCNANAQTIKCKLFIPSSFVLLFPLFPFFLKVFFYLTDMFPLNSAKLLISAVTSLQNYCKRQIKSKFQGYTI